MNQLNGFVATSIRSIKTAVIALTLVCGVSFASVSHATIIEFEAIATVGFSAIPDVIPPGTEFTDSLVLDFGTNNQVTDVTDVVSWLGGAGPIIPTSVALDFSGGTLSGFIQGLTDGLTAIDVWANGVGSFTVSAPDGVLLAGTNVIAAVPEPAATFLFVTGLFGLVGFSRKRIAT